MAETSSLLRNRTLIRTEGSNPSLSAISAVSADERCVVKVLVRVRSSAG